MTSATRPTVEQPVRLVDMLEFDEDDLFFERVFAAYLKLYEREAANVLYLVAYDDHQYEMYWDAGSPGPAAVALAVALLDLRSVEEGCHRQAWFHDADGAVRTWLKQSGLDVRVVASSDLV